MCRKRNILKRVVRLPTAITNVFNDFNGSLIHKLIDSIALAKKKNLQAKLIGDFHSTQFVKMLVMIFC